MNLRNLPPNDRRQKIEHELEIDLSALSIEPRKIGYADQQNCEQMFGCVPIPVGYAGPLPVTFSSGETQEIHLPLATTEAALVASVNRGCKALRLSGGVTTTSTYHGITRSLAFMCHGEPVESMTHVILRRAQDDTVKRLYEWKVIGESTSHHLKILKYEIDIEDPYLFITIFADTDEAMGMNMVTIAAQKIGEWIEKNIGLQFITVAGNVDSDKKPSKRTKERGRGYEVTASADLSADVIQSVLKTDPETLCEVAHAKLDIGSSIAGALGSNLHAANIIAALYLATGQDAAHVVEGSLTDTAITKNDGGILIRCHLPALLIGTHGGGTSLPAQSQCLSLLLKSKTSLHPCKQLAESIAAAVLAGELSLLAAQTAHHLANAHTKLARV
ncbi:hypothetical protein A2635_01945 [Candidatus Peribacteria bacterium RIFCSPHIGHO2_01_FULL_51_9]|nr:MAG: hypothetical protein A2635_01945 [Candidatus Peribacteria bacterium RIFCSPHIGHO2_01_FULL_51_9]